MIPSYRKLLEPIKANKLFNVLMGLEWLTLSDTRKEYFMSDVERSYTYGKGKGERTYLSKPYIPEVDSLRTTLNAILCENFDLCFLNRYDDAKNHLGWHADDTSLQSSSSSIAVISLGAEREIWWKLKEYKGEIPQDQRQLLENGSLFVMPPLFQETYYHKIPKCNHFCRTRISLTFRQTS